MDYEAERLAELASREHIPPLPEPFGLDERPGNSLSAGDAWKTIKHQLSMLLDRPSYDIWLKDARLVGYECGTFWIGVPTAHAQDMLQHRYYRNIQRVFEGLINRPVNLVFEVSPPLQLHQRPLSASERDELQRLRTDGALV